MVDLEVGNANGPDPPLAPERFQRFPSLDIAIEFRQRPMDQIEIDNIEPQPPRRLIKGPACFIKSVARVVQLRGHENLGSGQLALGDGSSDALLVSVEGCRVDAAVTGMNASFTKRTTSVLSICQTPNPSWGMETD